MGRLGAGHGFGQVVGGELFGGGLVGHGGDGLVQRSVGLGQGLQGGRRVGLLGVFEGVFVGRLGICLGFAQGVEVFGLHLFSGGLEVGRALGLVQAAVGLSQGLLRGQNLGWGGGCVVNDFLRFGGLRQGLCPRVGGSFVGGNDVGGAFDHLAQTGHGGGDLGLGSGFGARAAGQGQRVLRFVDSGQAVGDGLEGDRQGFGFVDLRVFLGPHRLQVGVERGQSAFFGHH